MVHAGSPDVCEALGLPMGCDANWSLTAVKFANGEVIGQFSDMWPNGDGFHAVLDCLSVDGNEAWVSGVVTRGLFEGFDFTGASVSARVRDNGHSRNDPADEISFSQLSFVPHNCDDQLAFGLFETPQGQVTVR